MGEGYLACAKRSTFAPLKMLRIYFAASLRGGVDFVVVQPRVRFLESFGTVLTRHLASPRTADFGTDAEIFAADQRMIAEADVFIGDFSAPSTGSGFMAARAVASNKPVLALFREGQKPSAMISGCPDIDSRFFADEAAFRAAVRSYFLSRSWGEVKFKAPRVVLAGPPGSGKGTLGAALSRELGAPHISTGELLRSLTNRPDLEAFMKAGQLVPAPLMRDLVLERLSQPDCRLFGFILDGYPPSREDLENLRGLVPDLVCSLECPDDVAVKRQVTRAARSTDTPEKAQERLAVFHRAGLSVESWYPESVVMRVDADQPAAAVEAAVLETVDHLFGDPRREHSFFTVSPFKGSRSSRVHFHVDAPGTRRVHALAQRIHVRHAAAQGQVKLYPLDSLHLGAQVAKLPIYRQLPNFHPFSNAEDEAFLTGRLGDGDDALMKVVLEETRAVGGMAELEEYLGEWTLQPGGEVTVDARYEALPFSEAAFGEFAAHRCSAVPTLELHLGFDLPKRDGEPMPWALPELMEACQRAGLENGGCFVFKKQDQWAYRLNEFSSEPEDLAEAKLFAQARALAGILRGVVPVSFSLERVHGIWVF